MICWSAHQECYLMSSRIILFVRITCPSLTFRSAGIDLWSTFVYDDILLRTAGGKLRLYYAGQSAKSGASEGACCAQWNMNVAQYAWSVFCTNNHPVFALVPLEQEATWAYGDFPCVCPEFCKNNDCVISSIVFVCLMRCLCSVWLYGYQAFVFLLCIKALMTSELWHETAC